MATLILGFTTWFAGLSPLVQGLLRLGLGLALNALVASRQKQRANYKELQQEFQQTDADARGIYGRVLASGVRAFWAHKDGKMHKILILATGVSDGIETVLFDGKAVALDGSKEVTTAQYVVGGASVARVDWRLGAIPETAYAQTVAQFAEWTTDHRLDGLTSILEICDRVAPSLVRDVYPTGDAPQVQVVMRGRPCYDPRTTSTVWTENPVPQLLDYLTSADGGGEALSEFHLPDWESMADLAEEAVALNGGGTEPRYRCALIYRYSEPLKDVVNRFLGTFFGRIRERPDGLIGLTGGRWVAPTFTIEEDHLIAIEYGPGDGGLQAYSALISRYIDPLASYTAQTTDEWQDAGLITRLGGVIRETAERLEVPSHSQCRRLDKMQIAFDNPEFRLTLTLRFFGLLLMDQDTVYVNLPERGLSNVPFWVDSWNSSDDFTTFIVTLRKAEPTSFDWDETTEEGTPPAYPLGVTDGPSVIPAPTGLAAAVTYDISAGTRVLILTGTWNAPAGLIGYRTIARFRRTSGGIQPWRVMAIADDGLSAIGGPLVEGETYELEVYHTVSAGNSEPGTGGAGPSSQVTGVLAEITPSIVASQTGLGNISLTAALDPSTTRVRVYRGTTANFVDAVPVGAVTPVSSQGVVTLIAGDPNTVNVFANEGFATADAWILGANWSISVGKATHATGAAGNISQNLGTISATAVYGWAYDQSDRTTGGSRIYVAGTTTVSGSFTGTNGPLFGTLTTPAAPTAAGIEAQLGFDGSVDNVRLYERTADCLAQGAANFWVSPVTASGQPTGTPLGPVSATII